MEDYRLLLQLGGLVSSLEDYYVSSLEDYRLLLQLGGLVSSLEDYRLLHQLGGGLYSSQNVRLGVSCLPQLGVPVYYLHINICTFRLEFLFKIILLFITILLYTRKSFGFFFFDPIS